MGDRISIQFRKDGECSVALFSHWGGKRFAQIALNYAIELKKEIGDSHVMPLDRMQPNTVMLDFIRYVVLEEFREERIKSAYYLGKDSGDGDNSDNGNYIIDLDQMNFTEV